VLKLTAHSRGNFADSSNTVPSLSLIKQCHLCCVQYIAECYYNSVDESDKDWLSVCVALEPVTEMLMSFLMSLPPPAAAASDLYAVAAAFFKAGGAKAPPAVFAQELDVAGGGGRVDLELFQTEGLGAGTLTPTTSVGGGGIGGGMSVGSQPLQSPATLPPSSTRPSSVAGGGESVVGTATVAALVAPKRYNAFASAGVWLRVILVTTHEIWLSSSLLLDAAALQVASTNGLLSHLLFRCNHRRTICSI
jgi:hypothetical protein